MFIYYRKYPLFFLLLLSLIPASCARKNVYSDSKLSHSSIHEISSIADIDPFLKTSDLVVFDIDNTLLEAKNSYCHVNVFYDLLDEGVARGVSELEIMEKISSPWEKLQKNCAVKPVEALIPHFIWELQKTKKVMALTSRSGDIADETIAQLKAIGVDFSLSAPKKNDIEHFGKDLLYKDGVIFTSEKVSKGPSLKAYLARCGFSPKHVLFVDDRFNNLVSVDEVLKRDGVKIDAFFYPRVQRTLPYWDKVSARNAFEDRQGKIIFNE